MGNRGRNHDEAHGLADDFRQGEGADGGKPPTITGDVELGSYVRNDGHELLGRIPASGA